MGVSPYRLAVAAVCKFAERDEWRTRFEEVVDAHLEAVCAAFDVDEDDLAEILGEPAFSQLLDFIAEDFFSRDYPPPVQNVIQDYLARRGWRESGAGRLYLQALRASIVSLYEVTATVPGSHFLARDLVRGGPPVPVYDQLGSQNLVQWDRIAARLLPLGGRTCMSGGALLFEFEDAAELLDRLTAVRKKLTAELAKAELAVSPLPAQELAQAVTDASLKQAAPLFTTVWLSGVLDKAVGAEPPKFVNSEGDDLVFATTRFPVPDPALAGPIEARLDGLRQLYRDDPPAPSWTWCGTTRTARKLPSESVQTFQLFSKDQDHRTVLGTIELEAGNLVLETNSEARAGRGRAMLAEALGALVGTPLTALKSAEQAVAEPARKHAHRQEPKPLIPPAEKEALVREFLTRQYQEVLTRPLPILGGKTPRQAVRSKAGRQQVADWLKYLENRTKRQKSESGVPSLDFGWMWEELKIADLRQ